jgi:hypothetical protein
MVRDPRCAGGERIASVWVLPTGTGSRLRAAMGAPNAKAARAAYDENTKAQAGVLQWLDAHGGATPPGPSAPAD